MVDCARPVLLKVVADEVPASTLNGPEGLVERYITYDVAPGAAAHVTVIEVVDVAFALTDVGVEGGSGKVVALTGGVEGGDVPPVFVAVIS